MFELKIRLRWQTVALAAGAVAAAVILWVAGQELLTLTGVIGHKHIGKLQTDKVSANFDYLVPQDDVAWISEDKHKQTDTTKGLVTYQVTFVKPDVDVTISQQQLPDALQPRGSDKFKAFINDQHPASSRDVGDGTLYYLPMLQNGQPANGTNTVIYATDQVLLFAKGNGPVDLDSWAKLMAAMNPH